MALLHGLHAAGYLRLVVCHLDHGLRARAGRADAAFVTRLAADAKLPVETGRADVRAVAREQKFSLETAAREARFEFFAQAARRRHCRTLFLAHHADDQVETFLFNLLRGSGPAGLAGMAAESLRVHGRMELRVVRPLLGVWRKDIDAYLETRGLKWREDRTNADPAFATRNRLRAEVLPLLEQALGRNVRPALWRAADILGAEERWVNQLLDNTKPIPSQLSVTTLETLPVARQRRLIRSWLMARGVNAVGYEETESVRGLLDKETGPAKVNLPGNRHARRRNGKLFVE